MSVIVSFDLLFCPGRDSFEIFNYVYVTIPVYFEIIVFHRSLLVESVVAFWWASRWGGSPIVVLGVMVAGTILV